MCVVALVWQTHPRWQLVLAGNRDEFHARPSAALAAWSDAPEVIAGRDLRSGGSWLGVSSRGRMAVITNVAGQLPDVSKATRGALVSDWLGGTGAPPPQEALPNYNAFNLILAEKGKARLLTNRPKPMVDVLGTGIHCLSNGEIGVPWPRSEALGASIAHWCTTEAASPQQLFEPLAEPPLFISDADYGTRCSTIITIDHDGAGQIIERRFGPEGLVLGETSLNFRWG